MYSIKMQNHIPAEFAGPHRGMEKPERGGLPLLEPFYYLKNFELVLSTIATRKGAVPPPASASQHCCC